MEKENIEEEDDNLFIKYLPMIFICTVVFLLGLSMGNQVTTYTYESGVVDSLHKVIKQTNEAFIKNEEIERTQYEQTLRELDDCREAALMMDSTYNKLLEDYKRRKR